MTDKCKQSLYFPAALIEEMQAEALRQDRSMSWLVQQAWLFSKERIAQFPTFTSVYTEKEKEK